jgi:hypothetical protein
MPESSSGPLLGLVIGLFVAVLLAVTNPTPEAHRKALASEYDHERPVAGAIGLGAVSAAPPEYHSFVLGSYTTEGQDEITSIGLLGVVFTM